MRSPEYREAKNAYSSLIEGARQGPPNSSRPILHSNRRDECSCTTTRRFMRATRRRYGFARGACSPDINPIENVWGIIARNVFAETKQYETVEKLKEAIEGA